jgi:uncharacterized protein (DUF2141 family)
MLLVFHALIGLMAPLFAPPADRPLVLTISGYENRQAPLRVGVFPPTSGFPKNNRGAKGYEIKPNSQATVTLPITDLDYGEYAIAVFQDLNNNGRLDTGGLLGMPKEPYCFSNNFRPMSHLRAPRFADCRFTYGPTQTTVRVQMLNN